MAEAGGTTTQSGIYYQNSIASLYLGRLIDPLRTSSETIESVRVEAPEEVDDIVITYANGAKEFVQAKERLSSSSSEWNKLWVSFKNQADICQANGNSYSLILTMSNTDQNIQSLKELCERAKGKENREEWIESLNTQHVKIVEKIKQPNILIDEDAIFNLLKYVEVKVIPLNDIENDYLPHWIPNSSVKKKILFSHLRDLVGGYARVRRVFKCSKLLEELLLNYEIEINDSPNWGVSIYKEAIKKEFRLLTVPGTELCGAIDELFLWSTLYENSLSDYQDFEFEDLSRGREIKPKSSFELKDFPKKEISQAVINAGAGLGKTTLLRAITYKLSHDKIILPTFIPLSTLIKSTSVLSYLNTKLNDGYQVNIDWGYMCLVGRVSILFDGLDELSNTERQNVLTKVAKHIARFPQTSFLLTVRDSSILTKNLDVKILEIKRLTDENIIKFSKSYNKFGAKVDGEILLKHSQHNSELTHLLRIPLFLSLLLAILKPNDNLPNSRDEILEKYLDILFSPEKYKSNQEKSNSPYLREVAESLAYEGLNKERIGFSEKEIKKYLRDLDYCDNPTEYLENLNKYGILSKVSNRLQFTYPTIQEYLASQYILEYEQDEIGNSFEKIISKPWAQTMQFVLESYPDSNEIIKAQLEKDDDAFFTSLRLISRCVINGANIEKDIRSKLGNLLANAWITSESSSVMESVGHLLLDGFVSDLPKKAEEYIIHGWALGYGGAEILTAKKDKTLTEKVLINMLSKNMEHSYHLHGWQEVVDDIAKRALDLYIDRAIDEMTDKEEISALRSLIGNLDESKISQSKWIEIVKNERIPSIIRFSIAIRIPDLVDEELKQLYTIKKEEWLKSEEYYSSQYEFKNLFWQMPECEFFNLVEKKALNDIQITDLLDNLFSLRMEDKFLNELLELYDSKFLSDDIKFKLNLLLSSTKVFRSQIYAIEQLTIQHIDNVISWCFLIGHTTKKIALKGLKQLSKRSFTNEEFISILWSLNTGLNYIMTPTLTAGGTLENRVVHPALSEFSNWLLEEFSKYKFTDIEYIKVLDEISQISSERIEDNVENRLLKIISNWIPKSDDYYDEEDDKIQWSIINGLRLCEREKIQLSENTLIKILKLKKFNLVNDSLKHLLKIADINTMKKIIEFHSSLEDTHMRGSVNSAIEKIANRLEVRIIRVDGDLIIE